MSLEIFEQLQDNETGQKGNSMGISSDTLNTTSSVIGSVSRILDLRGSSCPSCESENYSNERCYSCGYGTFVNKGKEDYLEEDNWEEEENIEKNNRKNGEEIHFKIRGADIIYFYHPKKIKENEATLKIKKNSKIYIITVGFNKTRKKHFQDPSIEYYHFENIDLKKPKNFDGNYKIVNSNGTGVYLDYNFALEVSKKILYDLL